MEVVEQRADIDGFVDNSEELDFTADLDSVLKGKYRRTDQDIFSKIILLLGGRYCFSFSAAGALPAYMCKRFMTMRLPVIKGYGLVETSNTVSANSLDKIRPGSIGPISSGVEALIAEDGKLLLRGDNIIRAYWNNPGLPWKSLMKMVSPRVDTLNRFALSVMTVNT